MTARDELAPMRGELQDLVGDAAERDDDDWFMQAANAILSAGYRKPRTISTEADLESLPIGSVIWAFDFRSGDSDSWQLFDDVIQLTDEDGDIAKRAWVSSAYQDEHSSNRVLLRTNGHPITVLYEPTP